MFKRVFLDKSRLDLKVCLITHFVGLAVYFSAAVGACMDVSANENGKVNFDLLSKSLDSTLRDTKLVFELVKSGGYAMKIPLFTAFGIGLYALNKYTSRKKFHRKGEEHGSARWANAKEVRSLLDKPKKQKLPFKVKVHNFFERLKFWKRKKKEFVADNNIILTNEVKMSLNTRQTRKNLNVMVIGGSGSGKSRFYVKSHASELLQRSTRSIMILMLTSCRHSCL